MKKVLIATTALVLTAGIAAADVTLSGYGRTGILYAEDKDGDTDNVNNTIVQSRLRLNVDASTSTDQGVDFGGRFRVQWDQGNAETALSPAYIYITSNGLRVEIGNSNTAYDSAGLMYAPELGVFDSSFGTPRGSFYAYSTRGYPSVTNIAGDEDVLSDYLGIYAQYTMGDVTVRGSYVDPDQVSSVDGLEKEYGLSVDYTWNERLELSAAAVQNGASIEDNDQYFVGARYAVMDNARVGLNWMDNGEEADGTDLGKTITLYGDYTTGLLNFEAYVANNNADGNDTDNAFGLGVNYDLGGARLSAGIQRGFDERVIADAGVRFDF